MTLITSYHSHFHFHSLYYHPLEPLSFHSLLNNIHSSITITILPIQHSPHISLISSLIQTTINITASQPSFQQTIFTFEYYSSTTINTPIFDKSTSTHSTLLPQCQTRFRPTGHFFSYPPNPYQYIPYTLLYSFSLSSHQLHPNFTSTYSLTQTLYPFITHLISIYIPSSIQPFTFHQQSHITTHHASYDIITSPVNHPSSILLIHQFSIFPQTQQQPPLPYAKRHFFKTLIYSLSHKNTTIQLNSLSLSFLILTHFSQHTSTHHNTHTH